MVSTSSSAGWPTLSIAARISPIRLVTPVEVSLCTTITALMTWVESWASLASISAGSAPWRQSPGMKSTSMPKRPAICRHNVAKWPVSTIRTLSPGDSVLTIAASQAPVPDEGKMTTGPAVLKIFWQPSNTALPSSANCRLRWSMTGMSMARRTRSGTGLGPGICKKWRPWCCVMNSSSDLRDILHSIHGASTKILCTFRSTSSPSTPMFRAMKPLIPSDATSKALNAGADSDREDQSLHDEILTRLRDHIVEGNIPDGGRVPERQLCEMLGISRTPLREALKVLASEGLVELLPNRGARVRQLSEHELGELFDVMGGLEGLAGRLACENITDAEIAEIERLHYEMYGFYLHRDMHGYFRVNQLIHRKIVEASRNAALKSTYANFAGRIRRIRYSANFARKRERWAEAMREHETILEALRRRAGSELSDILFLHLRNKRTAAVEHLKADSVAAPEPA